ncbi:MAG: glycosyltransferase family A protein [Gemmatimonadaceae bacterium]
MSTPVISCVIPVFNGERYIRETIERVLQQSVAVADIIVVDDGSTDETAGIVRSFGDRVRLLQEPNAGPAAARNLGVTQSIGEFITFQDADDLWSIDKTQIQLRAFADDPLLMICVGHVENFASPDVPAEMQLPDFAARNKPMAGYTTPCLMVRRKVFDAVGMFDANLKHTDAGEWFKRARALGVKEKLLPDVLVQRRLHATNRSRVFADESRAEFLQLLKAGLDRQRIGGAGAS